MTAEPVPAPPPSGAGATAAVAAPGPVPRVGARSFLELDRVDLAWLVGLVAVAFLLRVLSPIFPDALPHPFSTSPVTPTSGLAFPVNPPSNSAECVDDLPVGPNGTARRACGFVFDEVYFPVDAVKDLHRIDYFDPEPPLSKLLMAPPIALFGFTSWAWRLTTAIAGSLLVGTVYLIAMRLRRDRFFAVAAAGFVALDGLAFVESRTGVIDIIAIFFATLAYYAFLLHWQARTRTQWRVTLYLFAIVTGLAFGAKLTAIAPTVVAATLIVARFAAPWVRRAVPAARRIAGRSPDPGVMWRDAAGRSAALHYAAAALLAGALFVACYARYLSYDHQIPFFTSGAGDCALNASLQYDTSPAHPAGTVQRRVPVIHAGGLTLPQPVAAVQTVITHTQASLEYHRSECHTHPYASEWYTWPLIAHPVLFFADYSSFHTAGGAAETAWVTDMGNPALWWMAVPALLFCVWRLSGGPRPWRLAVTALGLGGLAAMIVLYHAAERSTTVRVHPGPGFTIAFLAVAAFCGLVAVSAVITRRFTPAFIVLGYLAAWLMWVDGNQDRVLFYYHMLGALLFTALALAYALTALRRSHLRIAGMRITLRPAAHAAVLLVVAAFVFFYPVWTGAPQTGADHARRIWLTQCVSGTVAHNDSFCWQ